MAVHWREHSDDDAECSKSYSCQTSDMTIRYGVGLYIVSWFKPSGKAFPISNDRTQTSIVCLVNSSAKSASE